MSWNLQRQCFKCLPLKLFILSHLFTHNVACVTYEVNFSGELVSGKVTFIGNNLSQQANSHGKSTLPGSQLTWEVNFHGKLAFPGSLFSWEVSFPKKSTFIVSKLSWELIFPGKPTFPGSQLSWEVNFPREVNFPWKSIFPGSLPSLAAAFPTGNRNKCSTGHH